ncbi:unnamed protein product, partial [marine sediment metagenome]
TGTQEQQSGQIEAIQGKYLDYEYMIGYKKSDKRYVATFTPFLPRNDSIVTLVMLEMIKQVYGKHKITNLEPQLIERSGTNLIMFEGVDANYLC